MAEQKAYYIRDKRYKQDFITLAPIVGIAIKRYRKFEGKMFNSKSIVEIGTYKYVGNRMKKYKIPKKFWNFLTRRHI